MENLLKKSIILCYHWAMHPGDLLGVLQWFLPILPLLYLHQVSYFGDYTPMLIDGIFVLLFWKTNFAVARSWENVLQSYAVPVVAYDKSKRRT